MQTLLDQAIDRRPNQPQTEPDPTMYPPLQIPQPQTEEQPLSDSERELLENQFLATCAMELIEGLEGCDRKDFLHFEPEHTWPDTEEGEVTSAPAVVLVIRGKPQPEDVWELLCKTIG